MTRAVAAIKRGMTYREAAAKHCVKRSTLHARVTSPPRKRNMKIALTNKEEDLLVSFLIKLANRGVPLTQEHLQEAVKILVNGMDPKRRFMLPFRHGVPGRAFLGGFRQRHKDKLSFAKPVRQEAIRFSQVNADALTTHFATLDNPIREHDLDSNRIFNLDESGITPDRDMYGITSAKRFMPRSACRDLCTPEFRNLNRVTHMPIISASRACAPPLFVFKGLRLPYRTIVKDGHIVTQTPLYNLPKGSTARTREETGGIDTARFLDWGYSFVEYVEPLTKGGRKVLLIYDGYRAHLSLAILELFNKSNIIVHPTRRGKLSHLTLSYFRCLKTDYKMQSAAALPLAEGNNTTCLICAL